MLKYLIKHVPLVRKQEERGAVGFMVVLGARMWQGLVRCP